MRLRLRVFVLGAVVMKNGSIRLSGKSGSTDPFPAKTANALFGNVTTPRLEEDLGVGGLKVLGEQQRLQNLA